MAFALGAVSPHLDDLALSCANVLAAHPGSSMVTVFAGGPASVDPVTGWEALSGVFEPGADIVGARRSEDIEAVSLLACEHRHLEHWDDQYRHAAYRYEGPRGEDLVRLISSDLEAIVSRSELGTWLIPLGISHPDHEIAAAACLAVVDRHPDVDWLVYEELPYATFLADRVTALTAGLQTRGFELQPPDGLELAGPGPDKRDVVSCYRSQVGPLGDGVTAAVAAPERIHRLTRMV
ncbi:MAG TPA: PIG-L family deacetylase [Acidimicrobiales bacterium]|jgi:LmbE family N-acetylglucosaminyl deacetylase|nr:PIG-L family deacetylase [Acidimicrobiales bacterium]